MGTNKKRRTTGSSNDTAAKRPRVDKTPSASIDDAASDAEVQEIDPPGPSTATAGTTNNAKAQFYAKYDFTKLTNQQVLGTLTLHRCVLTSVALY